MRILRLLATGWLMLVLPLSASCNSQSVAKLASATDEAGDRLPRLTGRVVDNANLIAPSAAAQLTRRLSALETRTTDQFVVVTLPSLGGETIEQYGLRLGRGWGIGQRGKNNGVLLIVAPTERKVRIEVGYGLENRLTDPIAAGIIQARILPEFRAGRMEEGIVEGVDGILAVLDAGSSAERKMAA